MCMSHNLLFLCNSPLSFILYPKNQLIDLIISISLSLGILITLGFDNELTNNIYNYFYDFISNYSNYK